MIKAYRITFSKLMTAGYISAETYQFVLPKERLYELNVSEINSYKHKYKSELLPLFEDEDTYLTIAYMEKLETQLREGDNTPYELLIDCLCEFPVEIEHIVNDIGKEKFLQDYVYCTEDVLKAKSLITNENIKKVNSFRNKFRSLFQMYCSGLDINECKSLIANTSLQAQADTIAEKIIMSGEGFNSTDYVSIDEDAVSLSNEDCKKYVLFLYSLNKDQLDSVIDVLISLLRKLSIRTWHGIKALGYRNFLINYLYAEPIKMYNLRNFGKKSVIDFEKIKPALIEFIKELYLNGNTESVEESIKQEEEVIISRNRTLKERIGQDQYKLVIDLLAKLLKESSVRSRNGIQAYKGDFIEDFVNRSNDIKSIKNIGEKSESEIAIIIEKLREFVATLEECEISPEVLFWMKKKEYYDKLLDEFCWNYYSSNQVIPMLHVLENCFNEMIKKRPASILNEVTPFYKGKTPKTLNQVGENNNLTRERVRQICVDFISAMSNFYSQDETIYHKTLSNNEDWNYLLEQLMTKPIWKIFELETFAQRENCSLTVETISLAFSLVFRDTFELIGKRPISITSSKTDWSNTFLVNKSLSEIFDFEKMLHELDQYQQNTIEPITITVSELLNGPLLVDSWKIYMPTYINDLGQAVTQILMDERDIIFDANLMFKIEGKKKEKPADVLYRILSDKGKPLDLDFLFDLFKKEYMKKYKSSNSLKSIISKDSRMCLMGVNNMVTLYEWEHIIIGNIRQLIVSYLEQFNEPQQFSKIVEHILTLRDTTEESVRQTMTSGGQFKRFAGGLWGLSDRTYPEWFYLSESERNSRDKIKVFETFLKTNGHFPFCPSENKEEELLYQWWKRINRQENLSEMLKKEINRIKQTYIEIPKNKTDLLWFEKCKEFELFFTQNRRMPDDRNEYEKGLSKWLNKSLHDSEEGKLSSERERTLIKLCQMF